jgi:sulfite reductase beta subunit-like hemoprotein
MARPVCGVKRTAADRCPGNLALHRAQDGWLARIRIPGGRVTAEQLGALSRAAELGNGLVELTSRANLQLRGLPADAGEELAAIMHTGGLLPSVAHDRVRNVIASPLAGRHPRSCRRTDVVVASIDRELCADPALGELPGRFLFAVDDGSGLALDHRADVALVARDDGYALVVAGHLIAGALGVADAAATAVKTARAFLAERRARGLEAWRIGELDNGAAAVAARLGLALAEPTTLPARGSLAPGALVQQDGRLAVTALAPLGRLDRGNLVELAALAPEIRVGTGRTLTVLDVDPDHAAAVSAELSSLGLELQPDSGWVGLSACAGLGRCPNARLDVAVLAATRAGVREPGSPAEHWAACERRCGERARQPVAIAAAPGEAIAVRMSGGEQIVASVEEALVALASR